MKTTTACLRDCHDTCSVNITTSKSGKYSLRGNPDHPFTKGFVCAKIQDQPRLLTSPDRIVEPQLRTGASWRTIGWDAALDLCADKIQALRGNPESILYLRGGGSMGVLASTANLLFSSLGASSARGSLCNEAAIQATKADFGRIAQNDPALLAEARFIVNWGRDFQRSSIHQTALIKQARKNGCRVLTISPGGDDNDPLTDDRILIRPGGDRFLAAALIKRLIESAGTFTKLPEISANWPEFQTVLADWSIPDLLATAGLSEDDLELALGYYTHPEGVATVIGWGLQRRARGGQSVRFIDALALAAGKLGSADSGVYTSAGSAVFNMDWSSAKPGFSPSNIFKGTIAADLEAIEDAPIQMLWMNCINLVNQAPDSRAIAHVFEKIDFKVLVDGFMTDTARLADLILPCALNFEQEDLVGSYTHPYINYARPAFDPPQGVRTDHRIMTELGGRLEPAIEIPDVEEIFERCLDTDNLATTLEELRAVGFARMNRDRVAYADLEFGHPDGRYRFPEDLTPPPQADPDYPLALLSLIRREATHSQMLPDIQDTPPKVWLSPDSQAWLGFDPTMDVYLATPLGRLRVMPLKMAGLHPDTVLYRRGDWWSRGGGINQLIEARLTDLGDLAAFYSQTARLEN